jgi:hypothetical protein
VGTGGGKNPEVGLGAPVAGTGGSGAVPLILKAFPLQAWTGPLGFQEVEAPEFLDNRHMKVVRFSALLTGRIYPQEGCLVLISVKRLSRPKSHNETGSIKSLKNSSDSIGNRTRDLAACSAVPQPSAPTRAPPLTVKTQKMKIVFYPTQPDFWKSIFFGRFPGLASLSS